MSRRTVVAVARPGGRFDCRLARGVDDDPLAHSASLGRNWTPERLLSAVDATVDRLLVVDGGSVRRYVVCWLDPTLSDATDVALARTTDPEALRAWWTSVKSAACRVLARNESDPATVRTGLLTALASRADRVHTDDAWFLRRDR